MQQKTFDGRALPGPARSPDAHPDVLHAVDVAASRPWKGTPRPLAAVTGALRRGRGKCMWKFDGMKVNGQGWIGSGNLAKILVARYLF